MAKFRSLKDYLAEEKVAEFPGQDWNKSRTIRWKLLHGQRVYAVDALHHLVNHNMRKLGFTVETGKDDEGTWAELRNPEHEPSDAQFEVVKNASNGNAARKKRRAAAAAQEVKPIEPGPDGRVTCPHCDKSYLNWDSLRGHLRTVHGASTAGLGLTAAKANGKPAGALQRVATPAAGVPATVPSLGSHLEVFLLHLNDDGEVNVGLRTADGGQYMAQLVGAVG